MQSVANHSKRPERDARVGPGCVRLAAAAVLTTLLAGGGPLAIAEEKETLGLDRSIYPRIHKEIAQNSSVPKTLAHLADLYGPRLTGTPRYLRMVQWVASRLSAWGVDEVRMESYGAGHRGWEVRSFSASLTAPAFANLGAQPVCCSAGTGGAVVGAPEVIDFYDLKALQARRNALAGKILLHPEVTPLGQPAAGIWSEERLRQAEERTDPITPEGLDGPSDAIGYVERLRRKQAQGQGEERALADFLLDAGVAALMRSSSAPAGLVNDRFDSGLVAFHGAGDPQPVPLFVLPREQHQRLLSLSRLGAPLELSLQLDVSYYEDPRLHVNLIADIPGDDPALKEQIVFLGAHLDSVAMATGAADNGVGAAAAMEALRVLKALELRARRTIRVALWGGEEQGLKGSSAYVKRHIGDIMTGDYFGEHQRISAYFNHDNNGHDIRGVFAVGHHAVKPIFQRIFTQFDAVGADAVTIEMAGGTDILVFDATGIPSFEWIHDPGAYFSHQLHTNLDVPALVNLASVNRNAAIIATVVHQVAMLDGLLPRKTR